MFKFANEKIEELYNDLFYSLDGSEPCFDPKLIEGTGRDTTTDLYVGDWTNRGVSQKVAEELCSPCHVQDKCALYAMAAKEPNNIWGGTRPEDRGIKVKYKG